MAHALSRNRCLFPYADRGRPALFRDLLTAEPAPAAYCFVRIRFKPDDPGAIEWLTRATEQNPSASDCELWLARAYPAKPMTPIAGGPGMSEHQTRPR